MTGGMVAPAAPSATRTHKNLHTRTHTRTHTHSQSCTRKHAATQPLSNKSAALLHPVRLSRGGALQTCCPVLSPLANFSTVQCPESCLSQRAGTKSCPVKPISGLHHPASLSPPFLLALLQPPLSSSFPLLCSRLCAGPSVLPATSVSALGPHPCFALSPSASVSGNRSISVTLCEHATLPPPSSSSSSSSSHRSALSPPSFPLLPSPSLPSSGKCAWIASLIAASLMLARMPPTVLLPCLFLPDVAQEKEGLL